MIITVDNTDKINDLVTIIPCHSTTKYVKEFQHIIPNDIITYFVFDRIEKPSYINNNYCYSNITNNKHCAGLCRDIGAASFQDHSILFFDEDKVPSKNPIPEINKLSKYYDVIVFLAQINDDHRKKQFIHSHGLIPQIYYNQREDLFTYTCGIYLNKKVIKDLRILNSNRIFHPIFDGVWGEEDDFLNDELLALGYKIGYSTNIILNGKISNGNKEHYIDLEEGRKRRYFLMPELSPYYNENVFEKITWGYPLIKNKDEIAKRLDKKYHEYVNMNPTWFKDLL